MRKRNIESQQTRLASLNSIKTLLSSIRVLFPLILASILTLQRINGASYAGGVEVMFLGSAMPEAPQSFQILVNNTRFNFQTSLPYLSQNDAFSSQTAAGKLQYTFPKASSVFGVTHDQLQPYENLNFDLGLMDTTADTVLDKYYYCATIGSSKCQLTLSRAYTPILYYMSPKVIYDGASVAFFLDPRSTQNYKGVDELFYTEAKIDGRTIYFDWIDQSTVLPTYTKNQVRGVARQNKPISSAEVNFQFKAGNCQHDLGQIYKCEVDNTNCYKARVVPVITSVSASEGYVTGGQTLKVTGYGLDSSQLQISIDGVTCKVLNNTIDQAFCQTGSNANPSQDTQYIGGPGLKRTFFNTSTGLSYSLLTSTSPYSVLPATEIETPVNQKDGAAANIIKGYFKPPVTGNYRFYLSCDDNCYLNLSSVDKDPSQAQTIVKISSATCYRCYQTSNWLPLEAGKYYYIEGQHLQYIGGDHFTVSVETDQNSIPNHQHSIREIQRLRININNTRDILQLNLTKMTDTIASLNIMNPTGQLITTSDFPVKGTADQIKNAFASYYWNTFAAFIAVEVTNFDVDGNIVADVNLAAKRQINIICLKNIAVQSTMYASFKRSSGIIMYPNKIQRSSKPLGGSFRIRCDTMNGQINETEEIPSNSRPSAIYSKIINACPNYRDKIEIWDGSYNSDLYTDGRDIQIRFTSFIGDPPQFQLTTDPVNPLQVLGEYNLNMTTVSGQTTRPYSTNLFYEPIPFEFLAYQETKSSILITADGLPAVCNTNKLDCTYSYIQPTPLITSFSLSGKILTIGGTGLITNTVKTVSFGLQDCKSTTVTDTQIICQVDAVVTGDWKPVVIDSKGIIPVEASQTSQSVDLTVTSCYPQTMINPEGENIITIIGTNFPPNLVDGSSIFVTLSDGTKCNVLESASTYIKCKTDKFTGSSLSVTGQVVINGKTDSSLSLTVTTAPAFVKSVNPIYASPVLKANLTIKISDNFMGTLDRNDLRVQIVDITNSSNVRQLNVIIVDNDLNTITVRYGGAYSGVYRVEVRSLTLGKFNSDNVILNAIGTITEFTPKSGSIYGGTLITITGYVYSNDGLDNPVRVGKTDCIVQTSTPTEITCRLNPKREDADNIDDVKEAFLVFLKTSEEAKCQTPDSKCEYEWIKTGLPVINSQMIAYSETLNDFELNISGSNLPTLTSDITFRIDGIDQEILSTSATEIRIRIKEMKDTQSTHIELYFPRGTPEGFYETFANGIAVNPTLLSISPAIGSPASSLITAQVKGLGVQSTATIALSTGQDLCQKVQIPSYGVLQCWTKVQNVVLNKLMVKVGTTSINCLTLDKCSFQTSSLMPAVSAVTLSVDKQSLTITGSNFFTTEYTGKVTFANVNADTVTIDSAISLTATWNAGVPVTSLASLPIVWFERLQDSHWASVISTGTVSNPISITSVDSSIQCSFVGGCEISVTQAGILSAMQSASSKLTICGQTATLSSQSTNGQAKFIIPSLSTTYSIDQYTIDQETYIMGTPFSSSKDSAQAAAAFDMENMNGFTDTSKNPCYVGTAFTVGHIGFLTEVKYFMARFNSANYIGLLSFQGSMDDATYTTIFTVGNEIHEGWNYHTYPEGKELKYRYYRFYGTSTKSCVIGEIGFRGVEVIDNNSNSYSTCPIQLTLNGGAPLNLTGTITYSSIKTPLLTAINPRWGQVQGGDTITFTGSNFVTDISMISILLDGIVCVVKSATTSQVQCTTGKRPGLYPDPTIEFKVQGYGNVATQGLVFRYVNKWSNTQTWGDEFIPMESDTLYIPKGLNLLVDVDSTPILQAVLVEGSLIFPPDLDPNHLRTFDAHYVMIKGGYMEVGTEEFPYTSKLIITMHSNKESPEIPIYGNKVIAVRHGILDIHGIPRTPTWTELDTTALPGDQVITLHTSVDWQIGEKLVVAPSSYDNDESEERLIVSVDRTNPNKPKVTLDAPLLYKHYAAIETYGNKFIEMRSEVALITRNIIYRGDPETSKANQFGAHIMLHSHGDESVIGRIEYAQFNDVGQAFQLGRYPIHFHMIGTVHKSYIKGNSISNTYNRAVTFHGVHYLRVTENVAYNTMGHTFFIEDAIETKNYIENNLAIKTKASFSLLITDQTPASFWITNPDNIFRGNHAAGSDRYGYWFDTKPNPLGPSFTTTVCPENSQLGEFANNVAHSNGKYGLRIFHNLVPRTDPCSPIFYNTSNPSNPYASNPLITANFVNLTSWKNVHNGAIAEKVGDVRFINFKVADNMIAGIEFSLTSSVADGYAQINNALVVGHSQNADDLTLGASFHGIITPRTENFQVHNVSFYNFDLNNQAALGSCSHCFHPAATDSGARTVTFSKLFFDASVKTKIRYQFPFRAIFYDLDGTLTNLGPKTWATAYFEHNVQPECKVDLPVYDGILCHNTVQVRRLAIWNAQPSNMFSAMELKVLKYDDTLIKSYNETELENYILNTSAYGIVPFKPKLDPAMGWAVPYVTGHKYKLHWRYGLDFEQMKIDLSSRWETTDKGVYLIHNFTDVRAKYDVITGGDYILNQSLTNKSNALWQTGDNVVYNDTSVRQLHFYINGKNTTRKSINLIGYRCDGPCLGAIDEKPLETTIRRWSDPNSWDTGKIPVANDSVVIKSGWNMLFDVEESPLISMLQINGRLTFEDEIKDLHLRTKYIFVRAGELIIGTQEKPFSKKALITLNGEKQNQHIVFDNAIEAGNKIIANTNKILMFGQPRPTRIARLTKSTKSGDTSIFVAPGLDWQAGERIGLAPTAMEYTQADYAVISSYNAVSGEIVLDRKLNHAHYGAAQSTASKYDGILDIRGEVLLLSSNIRIVGNDTEAWGGQIVTSDFEEANGVLRAGSTIMDNVEIYNCSQYDTEKAAMRFEMSLQGYSEITNSALYNGGGWGVAFQAASNVLFKNNIVFGFVKMGLNINTCRNITIDGNIIANIGIRSIIALDMIVDVCAGLAACAYEEEDYCQDIKITNNIVAGVFNTGYVTFGHRCGDYAGSKFKNNVAHSVKGTGAIIFPDTSDSEQNNCMEGSYFYSYKTMDDGAISYFSYNTVIFSNMIFVDNGYGPAVMVGKEGDKLQAKLKNISMYGEGDSVDCPSQNYCNLAAVKNMEQQPEFCKDRRGLVLSYYTVRGKQPLPRSASSLPIHKIKSDASWGGQTTYEQLRFIDFKGIQTYCGVNQFTIGLNQNGADYHPRAKFLNTRFENVHQDTVAFLFSPPWGWANLDDCGDWPCTAPSNALLQFENTVYAGTVRPTDQDKSFQIIAKNPDAVKNYNNCKLVSAWNAYRCTNDNLGILLFESQDEDKWRRMVSPIKLKSMTFNSTNKINTFMDHIWDGFYTGQLRMGRWPSIIQVGSNQIYEIAYSGTPPQVQKFVLNADYSGVVLRIDYTKPGAYALFDSNNNQIGANKWDDALGKQAFIKRTKCGENRYEGVVNILEFYITAGCTLFIKPLDSIRCNVRLDWTLDQFFADGGTTKFIDRLTASLGIHASNVKIVSVYKGSVFVEFIITDDKNAQIPGGVSAVKTNLQNKIKSKSSNLKFYYQYYRHYQ